MCNRGAGRGSTTSLGATRPITTAAGRNAGTVGTGCRRSATCSRSTRRRWSLIGGVELSISLGNQGNAPVGWFPLGPRGLCAVLYDRSCLLRSHQSLRQVQKATSTIAGRGTSVTSRRPRALPTLRQPALRRRRARRHLRALAAGRACGAEGGTGKIAAVPVAPVSAPPAPTGSALAAGKPADTRPPIPSRRHKPADAKAAERRPAGAPRASHRSGEDRRRRNADARAARDTGEGHRERSGRSRRPPPSRPLLPPTASTARRRPAAAHRRRAAQAGGRCDSVPDDGTWRDAWDNTGQAGDQTKPLSPKR